MKRQPSGQPSGSSVSEKENARWDRFYVDESSTPPWESSLEFSGLRKLVEGASKALSPKFFETKKKIVEIGSGASASAAYLSSLGHDVVAVDVSPAALERAKRKYPKSTVQWVLADLLSEGGVESITKFAHSLDSRSSNSAASKPPNENGFDFLLDIQCWHILRSRVGAEPGPPPITKAVHRLLRPNGLAMVVAGADIEAKSGEQTQLETDEDGTPAKPEAILDPGPPIITRGEMKRHFERAGFLVEEIILGRFNETPNYRRLLPKPPRCYIALLRKPFDQGGDEPDATKVATLITCMKNTSLESK